MSRQSTITRVETPEAAAHLHPQSVVHKEHHMLWAKRRAMPTLQLDLPGWHCPIQCRPRDLLMQRHLAVDLMDGGGDADAETWNQIISAEEQSCTSYQTVKSSPVTGKPLQRKRPTTGLRVTTVGLPPWFLFLHETGSSEPFRDLPALAMKNHEHVSGFPSVGAAISHDGRALACHVVYRTVDMRRQRILGSALSTDGNNKPLRHGAAAIATDRLQAEGMLEPHHASWTKRRVADFADRSMTTVDRPLERMLVAQLELACERVDLGEELAKSKDAYRQLVDAALAQSIHRDPKPGSASLASLLGMIDSAGSTGPRTDVDQPEP